MQTNAFQTLAQKALTDAPKQNTSDKTITRTTCKIATHNHYSTMHARTSLILSCTKLQFQPSNRLNYILQFNKQIAIVAINQCALANLKVNCSCNNRICDHRDNAPAHSTNSRKQIKHATQREYATNKSTNTTNLPIAQHPCCCSEYSCGEYSSCRATQF